MSMSFGFYRTPRLRFGAGQMANLAPEAAAFGDKLLIVAEGGLLRLTGRLDVLADSLKARGLTHFIAETSDEPSPQVVDAIVATFRDKGICAVAAVGGGSAMDAGKAVSAMLPHGGSVYDFLEGVGRRNHPGTKVPFIAVPTTAGTGSEATKNAVLSAVGADGFKKSLRHDNFVPDLAIVDPELSASCPPEVTAACGMDAFSQLLESYVSPQASAVTDSLVLDAIGRLIRNLVPACTEASPDMGVRGAMAYAAFVSGVGLANAGLGVIHGLAGPIGGFFRIPHGVVCGTLLGPAVKVTIEKLRKKGEGARGALSKFAAVGALFGSAAAAGDTTAAAGDTALAEGDVDRYCDVLVERIRALTDELRIPLLSDYGVTLSDCAKIVQSAGNKNNPIALDAEEMRQILRERIAG